MLYYSEKQLDPFDGEVFKTYTENAQYLISNFGRILSKQQRVKHNYGDVAIKKARILTQTDNGSGYLSVGLTVNGKTKTTRVSRLVALAFIPNPENKPQVNHVNGIKKDNSSINLEWNTSGENVMHAWNNDLAQKQTSYLYVKERLNKINPYITNRLRVITPIGIGTIVIDQSCYRIEYDNGRIENLVKSIRFWKDEFKICVRNIYDLTKEIEVNGKMFVPMQWFEDQAYIDWEHIKFRDYINPLTLPYCWVQKLLEWNFDIFGLLDKNLAVNINDIHDEQAKIQNRDTPG